MDQIFGMNMQKSGLIDTMWDLIVDSIGGLIASIAGYAFMKGNQRSYFSRLINIFIKDNPNLKV
jgi:RNAse (barnase) inhibitor barstar